MSFVLDKVSEDTFYENLLLGLPKILEKQYRFRNVTLQRFPACLKTEITSWEQFNGVKLPEDLKQFYLASNGFKLNWNYIFSQTEMLPVGSINVNSICDLTLFDVKITNSPDLKGSKFDRYLKQSTETKAFKLVNIDDQNFVTLIYGGVSKSLPQIFLIDDNFYGYYLTNSFRKYLRMAIVHLGLPYWQFCFTPTGIPSWAEQIYMIVAPLLPTASPVPNDSDETDQSTIENPNILDVSVFKLKPHESRRMYENQSPKNRKPSFK